MMGFKYQHVRIVITKDFKPHLQTLTFTNINTLSKPHDDFTTLGEVKNRKQNLAQILIEAIIKICTCTKFDCIDRNSI